MANTSLRERWATARATVGAWCFMPSDLQAELIAGLGYDYVGIDVQHGPIDFDMATRMIRAIALGGATPVVRTASNDAAQIGQMLDAGANAVIVPMINSAADAAAAARAGRYPPHGERSYGPITAEIRHGSNYLETAEAALAVIPMIETAEGLDAVEEIVAVDGVHAVYVGVFDLSIALGLPPGDNDGTPVFDDALQRVLKACAQAGVTPACHSNARSAALRLRQGFHMVTASSDYVALQSGLSAHLNAARAALDA